MEWDSVTHSHVASSDGPPNLTSPHHTATLPLGPNSIVFDLTVDDIKRELAERPNGAAVSWYDLIFDLPKFVCHPQSMCISVWYLLRESASHVWHHVKLSGIKAAEKAVKVLIQFVIGFTSYTSIMNAQTTGSKGRPSSCSLRCE